MTDKPQRPTDAELEILTVLWSRGPSTVRDVYETLQRRKAAQYSTVLKFMQIMNQKGLVRRDDTERADVYEAAQPRDVNMLQTFIEGVMFYNPAVWWISKVIRAEREHCCDDLVVAATQNVHAY